MKQLQDYLVERRLPIEKGELESIAENVIGNLMRNESKIRSIKYRRFEFKFFSSSAPINTVALSPEKRQEVQLARQRELAKRLKSSIYHWQPLSFDDYRSKIYLAANFAPHYAMLVQIFNEVRSEN